MKINLKTWLYNLSTNLLIIRHNNLHLGSTNERDKNKSNVLSHGKCIKKKFIYLFNHFHHMKWNTQQQKYNLSES